MNQPNPGHPFIAAAGALLLCAIAFASGVGAVSILNKTSFATNGASAALFPHTLSLDAQAVLGKAAIVYDPTSDRVLFAKNAAAQLPLASLTKLMTAQAVLEHSSSSRNITVTLQDLTPEGDWGFHEGDTVPLSELLEMGLVASSNDAMAAAASSLGADVAGALNQSAQNHGLSEMYFLNPTGLDESSTTAGAYGSAFDVARLAALFYKNYPQYFELTTNSSASIKDGTRTLRADATADPLHAIPGLLGAKTGYTDLAGGNLVAVFDVELGHPLVAVVLGSTEEGRFDDITTLIRAARAQ